MNRFEGGCNTEDIVSTHDPVKLESLIGVFYILMLTIGFSVIVLLIEWIIVGLQDTYRRDVPVRRLRKHLSEAPIYASLLHRIFISTSLLGFNSFRIMDATNSKYSKGYME